MKVAIIFRRLILRQAQDDRRGKKGTAVRGGAATNDGNLFAEGAGEVGGELFADEVVGVVDFALGESAVRGAIGEGVGERFLVGGNLFALGIAEEVEEADAFEVRGLGRADNFLDLGLGDRLGEDDGEVAPDAGESGDGLVAFGLRSACVPGVEGNFSVKDGDLDSMNFELKNG